MSVAVPVPDSPVVSVAQANPRMEAIDAALPAADGIACFNSPIQFALAGMNARINHGLPLAVVSTCQALTTAGGGQHVPGTDHRTRRPPALRRLPGSRPAA